MEKIPEEIKKQIDIEATNFSTDETKPLYQFPANNAAYCRGLRIGYKTGAEFGYSLASKEIERLKGLIRLSWDKSNGIYNSFEQFKAENNL